MAEGTEALRAAVLDQAMIALLSDLQTKGLLNQTLVVLGAEFGSTAQGTDNEGENTATEHVRASWPGRGSRAGGE